MKFPDWSKAEILWVGSSSIDKNLGTVATATKDGFVHISAEAAGGTCEVFINNEQRLVVGRSPTGRNLFDSIFLPVKQGDTFQVKTGTLDNWSTHSSIAVITFLPYKQLLLSQGGSGSGAVPDYSKGKSVSYPYTVTEDGFISFFSGDHNESSSYGYINNTRVYIAGIAYRSGTYKSRLSSVYPVKKGDVVNFSGNGWITFYPNR